MSVQSWVLIKYVKSSQALVSKLKIEEGTRRDSSSNPGGMTALIGGTRRAIARSAHTANDVHILKQSREQRQMVLNCSSYASSFLKLLWKYRLFISPLFCAHVPLSPIISTWCTAHVKRQQYLVSSLAVNVIPWSLTFPEVSQTTKHALGRRNSVMHCSWEELRSLQSRRLRVLMTVSSSPALQILTALAICRSRYLERSSELPVLATTFTGRPSPKIDNPFWQPNFPATKPRANNFQKWCTWGLPYSEHDALLRYR